MATEKPAPSAMHVAGRIIGTGIGIVLGRYAGMNLLIPLGFALAAGFVLSKLLSGDRKTFVMPLAVQCGHACWFALGAAILHQWNAVLPDLAVFAIGLTWLTIAPGWIPVALLAAYHLFALTINWQGILAEPFGTNLHKAMSVHIVLRIAAVTTMVYSVIQARKQSRLPEQTNAEAPEAPPHETFNPYQPPRTLASSGERVCEGAGPWRDGASLVVRIGNAQLPIYCLKSNAAVDGRTKHVELEWVPHQGTWVLMLGALGYWISRSLYGRKIPLDLPLSEDWVASRRSVARPGWLAIIGGAICLIGGTFIYVFALVSGVPEQAMVWMMFPILIGPLIAIGGLIYLFVADKPLLTVEKVEDDFAWLAGASPSYLDRLTEW